MEWREGRFNTHRLVLFNGFVTAVVEWWEGAYRITVNGLRFKRTTLDLDEAKHLAESFIRTGVKKVQESL